MCENRQKTNVGPNLYSRLFNVDDHDLHQPSRPAALSSRRCCSVFSSVDVSRDPLTCYNPRGIKTTERKTALVHTRTFDLATIINQDTAACSKLYKVFNHPSSAVLFRHLKMKPSLVQLGAISGITKPMITGIKPWFASLSYRRLPNHGLVPDIGGVEMPLIDLSCRCCKTQFDSN